MKFTIAGRYTMCSTLILSDFWSSECTLPKIVKGIRKAIEFSEDDDHVDILYDAWCSNNKDVKQLLDNYEVSDFAFVVGTLEDDSPSIGAMKEFGFEFTEKVYNSKNDTTVLMFSMPVKAILSRLSEFDLNGNLIEKKEAA